MIYHYFEASDEDENVCICGKPLAHHADKPAATADATLEVHDLNVAVQHSTED